MFRAWVVAAVFSSVAMGFSDLARAEDAPQRASVENPATVALAKYRRALADAQEAHTARLSNSKKERFLLWRVVRPVAAMPSAVVARR